MRRFGIFLVAAVAGLSAGQLNRSNLLRVTSGPSVSRAPASPHSDQARPGHTEPPSLAAFLPPAGETWSFHFLREVATSMNGQTILAWKATGRMELQKTPGTHTRYIARFTLSEPLLAPFQLRVHISSPDGVSSHLEISPEGLPETDLPEIAALMRDVLQSYLLPVHRNSLGPYKTESQSENGIYRKSIVRFLDPQWQVVSSEHRHAAPVTEGSDHFTQALGELNVSQKMRHRFVRIETIQRPGLAASAPVAFTRIDVLKHPELLSRNPAQFQAPAPHEWTRLLERLERPPDLRTPSRSMQQLRDVRDLSRGIRADPARVTEVRQILLRAPDLSSWRTGVAALLESETFEGEKALIELHGEQTAPKGARSLILDAFTLAQRPLALETVQWLAEQDGSGLLALGSSLRHQPEEEKAWIRNALQKSAKVAASLGDRIAVIDAMGNSGDPGFLPWIRAELESSDLRLRAHAALALRLQQNSEAAELLTRVEEKDASSQVREAARRARLIQRQRSPEAPES